jgi:hypothetical protein
MNFIGQRILNETELLHNDQPHYFKNFISNPEEILSWNDVESCLNRPEIFNFEMIESVCFFCLKYSFEIC